MTLRETLNTISKAVQNQSMPDRLWSVEDIASYTGHAPNFAYSLKDRPDFPRPILLGKQPRWLPDEIRDWVKKQR